MAARLAAVGWRIAAWRHRDCDAVRIARMVIEARLFDPAYYLSLYPDVPSNIDPIWHFAFAGAGEGRSPHPLFDSRYYLRSNPDAVAKGTPAILHFLESGIHEGRNPHPLFATDYYLGGNPDVARLGITAFAHFLSTGLQEGRDPHPLFDSKYYLANNPEAAAAGIPPLLHFLDCGWRERRNPHPLFDCGYYLDTNPDVASAGVNPLLHYLVSGFEEGREPHPLFQSSWYLLENPEVARAGINPLVHYVTAGARLPRKPDAGRGEPVGMAVHLAVAAAGSETGPAPAFDAAPRPVVSVVICAFNQSSYSVRCLRALKEAMGTIPFEVIFVDDASTDDTPAAIGSIPSIDYVRNETNLGFVRSANGGCERARGEYILLLNNDTLPLRGFADALLDVFKAADAGVAGSMLLYPDGRLQEAGGIVWEDGSAWNYGRHQDPSRPEYNYLRDVDYCSAACLMIPRALWRRLKGFDERFAPAYYEDTDLAFRVRRSGRRVIYQPLSRVVHFEGVTAGCDLSTGVKAFQATNRVSFQEIWGGELTANGSPGSLARAAHRVRAGRCLFVDAATPKPDRDAGSADALGCIALLGDFGFHVTFLPESNLRHQGAYTERLQRMGIECLYSPYLTSARDFIERNGAQYDLFVLCRHYVAAPLMDVVRAAAPKARVVFETVDLHYLREQRQAAVFGSPPLRERAASTRRQELEVASKADLTLVRTQVEQNLLREAAPRCRSAIFPVVREAPGRTQDFAARSGILFVGGFRHPPNCDGICWFVREVFPLVTERLPDCTLRIAGGDPPPDVCALQSANIEVLGHAPDLAGLLEKCRLTVAPLLYGAGMKGKVLTSLAHGVPCVTSSVGAEGLGAAPGCDLLVADSAHEMADAVIGLYANEPLWRTLSAGGWELVRRRFSREAGARRVEEILRRLDLPVRSGNQIIVSADGLQTPSHSVPRRLG